MGDMTIRFAVIGVAVALALAPGDAGAFTGGDEADRPGGADYAAGKTASASGDYPAAIEYLTKSAAADPESPDSHNLLGYSFRKMGNVEKAFEHYREALSIDPKHRGANEYMGELYLELGDLANAEAHLKVLDKACFFGCEEYTELKEAVAAYKAARGG